MQALSGLHRFAMRKMPAVFLLAEFAESVSESGDPRCVRRRAGINAVTEEYNMGAGKGREENMAEEIL